MKNEINLLPPKKLSQKDSKDLRLIRWMTIGSLILIVSLSVGAFLITAFSPLPGLKDKESQSSTHLDSLRTKAVKYLITQKRLSEINSVISSRIHYADALENIEKDQPEELSFDGITLENKNVTLIVSSSSLLAINTLIQSLQQRSSSDKLYRNLVLTSLDFDTDKKVYKTLLTVTLR